ncbi:MAG TPA: LAGLIDADG family homing endonuclease [Ktedonobacteraceae bacterium]|nr:LAGLIDADG family homing endonuclease [Ktedonobacteraceae bacterium]
MSQQSLTPDQAKKLQAYYRQHPEWFFEHILGFTPYRQQIEIAQSVVHNRTTTVSSCNSAGKTGTSGCLVPWYLSSYEESIVVTTAPCYDDQTEILTRQRGWVLFRDLNDTDEVAQLVDGTKLEFVKPSDIITFPYKGEMIGAKNGLVDLLVTPNHRMWHRPEKSKGFRINTAEEIYGKWERFRKTATWVGKQEDPDWFEFLGFWFAEGWAEFNPPKRKYRVTLTQKKHIAYALGLVEHIGWLERAKVYPKQSDPACVDITIHAKALAEELVQYGKARTKHVPAYVKEANQACIKAFLDGYAMGDGSVDVNGSRKLCTSSRILADDLQELCIKAGMITNISCESRTKSYFSNLPVEYTAYCVRIWNRGAYPTVKGTDWYKQNYKGVVYCVKVPSGIVLVRRNGKYCWSGNTFRQVKDLLWREINTRYDKAKIPLGGDHPNVTGWQISSNWFAVGVSSKDPNRIQGYHADSGHILVIADEAAAIDELIFEGIYAILTSADARFLMLGNPTSQTGTFRDSHKPGSLAHRIRIDAFDTPNFIANNIRNEEQLVKAIESKQELLQPYHSLISPVWAYERLKKWGVGSPLYQSRIRAKFPEVGENNLIPLNWIEKACSNERLEKVLGLNLPDPTPKISEAEAQVLEAKNDEMRKQALADYIASQNTIRGVDVAREGSDSSVVTRRWGKVIGFGQAFHKQKTTETAGRVWPMIQNLPTDITCIDVIGVGGGVLDQLLQLQEEQEALGNNQWAQIIGVDVNTSPTDKPEGMPQMVFANKRAELYWKLMEMFESDDVYLMPDEDGKLPEELMDELSCIQYFFRGNKIFIEEKKEMKKRLHGKSPDRADSVMMTLIRQGIVDWQTKDEPASEDEDDADYEPTPGSAENEYAGGVNGSWGDY